MADVIVSALYLWLAVTAVALVVWIVKRMRANRRATQARQARAVDSLLIGEGAASAPGKTIDVSDAAEKRAEEAATAEAASSSASTKPAMATAGAPAEEKAESSAEAKSERETKSLGSVIASSVGAPPPRKEPDQASPSDAGVKPEPENEPEQKNPTEPAADDRRDPAPPTTTIAELLSGIRLPVDLQPVPPTDTALASTALTFTSDADPAAVGSAFADELERLGYEIYSLSDTDAVARRGGPDAEGPDADTLSMSIRLIDPGLAIDVWVGAGESPLSEG